MYPSRRRQRTESESGLIDTSVGALDPEGHLLGLPADEGDDSTDIDRPALSVTREDVEALIANGAAPISLVARFPDIAQGPATEIPGWGMQLIRRADPKPGAARYVYVPGDGMYHVEPMYGGAERLVSRVERAYGRAVHDAVSVTADQLRRALDVYQAVDRLLGGPGAGAHQTAIVGPSSEPAHAGIDSLSDRPVVTVRRKRFAA